MNIAGRSFLLAPALIALLSSCTSGEKPRAADVVAPSPAYQDFGDLRVHYNAIPTLSVSEAVAREIGIERGDGKAMLTVALRTLASGEELAADGEVQAVAVDLQGMRQPIPLRAVRTGEYTDYIGAFNVVDRDSYRLQIEVRSGNRSGTVRFQRNF